MGPYRETWAPSRGTQALCGTLQRDLGPKGGYQNGVVLEGMDLSGPGMDFNNKVHLKHSPWWARPDRPNKSSRWGVLAVAPAMLHVTTTAHLLGSGF